MSQLYNEVINYNALKMINAFQIQTLKLPPRFLFDSLKLYAKFQTTIANLAELTFQSSQMERQRIIDLNVLLKIPACRSSFTLFLEIIIINMPLPPFKIPINLPSLADQSQCCLIFKTDMGQVEINASLVEQIYLPKQNQVVGTTRSCIVPSALEEKETYAYSRSYIKEQNKIGCVIEGTIKKDRDHEPLMKKYFSSRRKMNGQCQKLSLSRTEYMKLDFSQNLFEKSSENN